MMATQIVNNRIATLVAQIAVDSACVELGDCGKVQLRVPTKTGDGLYPVYLSDDGCKIVIDTTPHQRSDLAAWRAQVRDCERGSVARPPQNSEQAKRISANAVSEIQDALRAYCAEVENSGLSLASQSIYIDMVNNFVRWIEGDFVPGSNKSVFGAFTKRKKDDTS